MSAPRSHADASTTVTTEARRGFRLVLVMLAVLVVPAALTLRTVRVAPGAAATSPNPTPLGYSWSLLLFVVPLAVLVGWFARRADLALARRAFVRTMAVLVPAGCGLDLLFGNTFFTFPNRAATLGLDIPARGGGIPVEEFIFYLSGFMLILLGYIWADEYWMRAYNVPDYRSQARDLRRIAQFHGPSLGLGAALIAAAVIYRKFFAASPAGFPWYWVYLNVSAFVPAAGFLRTAVPFVNWRAFSFGLFFLLLISLLWEVTLAIPYGWWGYRPAAMMGLHLTAWHGLPLEAVAVWISVSFTTVIIYEVIKVWQALGVGAWEAFFGIRPR